MTHETILRELIGRASVLPRVGKSRVIAAIYSKGKEIALATNSYKTDPFQAKFGSSPMCIYKHAEISVIKRAIKHLGIKGLRKCTLYVCRAKFNNERELLWGLAKPCSGCLRAIYQFGLKRVVYSEDSNSKYEILEILREKS